MCRAPPRGRLRNPARTDGHAPAGTEVAAKLTLQLDHSRGAGQLEAVNNHFAYNLPVPPYNFVSDTVVRVGENPKGTKFDLGSILQL